MGTLPASPLPPTGGYWVSTKDKGIAAVNPDKTYQSWYYPDVFLCIDATPDGKLWLGTGEGKVILVNPANNNERTDYTAECDMNGDMVRNIAVDLYNHVWILTDQNLKEFNVANGAYRNYLASDSWFMLNRFLPRALQKDVDGTLYVGGMPGIVGFRPSHRLESIPKPIVAHVTDVKVMGRSLLFDHPEQPTKGEYKMQPNEQNLEINFSTLAHRDLKQIRYAYRMIGVDKNWVYVGDGKNSAFYNRLSSGTYVFEVKATDGNGLWSNQTTTITICRLPAIYETWWAYLVYALVVLCTGWYLLHRCFFRIRRASEKKYEVEVNELKLQLEMLSPDEQFVDQALLEVEANLSNPGFDVTALAANLLVSRSTLGRKIKAVTGQSPLEFIRDIKMKHAYRSYRTPG